MAAAAGHVEGSQNRAVQGFMTMCLTVIAFGAETVHSIALFPLLVWKINLRTALFVARAALPDKSLPPSWLPYIPHR